MSIKCQTTPYLLRSHLKILKAFIWNCLSEKVSSSLDSEIRNILKFSINPANISYLFRKELILGWNTIKTSKLFTGSCKNGVITKSAFFGYPPPPLHLHPCHYLPLVFQTLSLLATDQKVSFPDNLPTEVYSKLNIVYVCYTNSILVLPLWIFKWKNITDLYFMASVRL